MCQPRGSDPPRFEDRPERFLAQRQAPEIGEGSLVGPRIADM
jgi:hypothetical protein